MKITITFLFFFLILLPTSVNAISPSASSSATPTTEVTPTKSVGSKTVEIINDFKDRIASRVAQLKLVKRQGVLGSVTEVSGTQITLNDIHNKTRFIDVDELTKFASPSASESFGLSDLTKGTRVGILGLYNKQSNRVLARFIDVDLSPRTYQGKIQAVDSKKFTFDITADDKKTHVIDVGNTTKIQQYKKDTGAIRAGFSKLVEGDVVVVVGYPDKKAQNLFLALRVLIFPEIGQPESTQTSLTPTEDAKTTITPVIKLSPTKAATNSAR